MKTSAAAAHPPTPVPFVPPGHDTHAPLFGTLDEVQAHRTSIPARLHTRQAALIEVANDFHFAMLNDQPRNEFYKRALARAILPGQSIVLDIGSGSGLLSILAAQAGAQGVKLERARKRYSFFPFHPTRYVLGCL
jgi:hypothetical protein